MIRRIMSCALVCFAASVATTENVNAQVLKDDGFRPFQPWRNMLLAGITPTESQKKKIDSIALSTMHFMIAVQPKYQDVGQDSINKMLDYWKVQQAYGIRTLLTPEQRKPFDEHLQAWKDRNHWKDPK
jgi:hypothetical protein